MKDKKLQVFVSSTYLDLKEERQAAVEAILTARHIPAGMELFTAGDQSQWEVIKRWIDESDVYMLILGARYGSVDPVTGKSYTQLEYEYALTNNKPLFAVVLHDTLIDQKVAKDGRKVVLEELNGHLLADFKKVVMSKLVKICNSLAEIQNAVFTSLNELSYRDNLVGWVRGDQAVDTGPMAVELARLSEENATLRLTAYKTTDPIFNGLTFDELKELLIDNTIRDIKGVPDLFSLFIILGPKLVEPDRVATHLDTTPIIIQKYVRKLVEYNMFQYVGGTYQVKATQDGHSFYIRHHALTLKAIKNT